MLASRLDDELPSLLLGEWPQHSPALRSAIVATLLSREPWMEALMQAIEAGDVPAGDMDASARQRLLTTWNGPVREGAARSLRCSQHRATGPK